MFYNYKISNIIKKNYFLILLIFLSTDLKAHTFVGMVGYYDGLSHPVLGFDHFLAMISVGIISAQIGGKAVWKIPGLFVLIMFLGGLIGIYAEINEMMESLNLNEIGNKIYFSDFLYKFIEIGILISVIILGFIISLNAKISKKIIMLSVGVFGFFHGSAHGLEMPQAVNPIFFALGFISGTIILHLFGVIVGYLATKTKASNIFLKILGVVFSFIGIYYFYNLF